VCCCRLARSLLVTFLELLRINYRKGQAFEEFVSANSDTGLVPPLAKALRACTRARME
jgi:hypothetical protein